MSDLPDHVRRNRALWDDWAPQYVASGEEGWAAVEPRWGIWGVPESQLNILPGSLAGKDAIELGCGTAYVSAWLARRGARVVGIDNSEAQLATARRLQEQHGLHFPLLHGSAEAVPYPDQSFDFAISEYGACLWADPERWVPHGYAVVRVDSGGSAGHIALYFFSSATSNDLQIVYRNQDLYRADARVNPGPTLVYSVPQYAAGILTYHWPQCIGSWSSFAKSERRTR